jgi:uncharacterized peroxidase-related enzyme
MSLTLHTVDTAPAAARPALQAIVESYGFLPNLAAVFAESPATLGTLLTIMKNFDAAEMTLSRLERQVVLLAASVQNNCEYCTAAHGMLAHMAGLDRVEVEKLQTGRALGAPRLQALRQFVQIVVEERGWVPADAVSSFIAAGFSRAQVLEVVLGIALKTLTNYVNHMAKPPVNQQFAAFLPRVEAPV